MSASFSKWLARSASVVAFALAVGAGSGLALAQTQDAAAPSVASLAAEIVVLHAKNDGTGIDPNIGKMPELGKPPFSSYDSYKLLGRSNLSLARGQPTTFKLPNGRDLMITWKDEVVVKGEPKKYVISTSIQKGDGHSFLPLLEVNVKAGDIFFVAGQKYDGGVLVFGIKILP